MTSPFAPPSGPAHSQSASLTPPPMSGMSGPLRAGFGLRLGGWVLDLVLYGLAGSVLVTPGFVLLRAVRSCDANGVCVSNNASDATVALNLAVMAVGLGVVLFLYIRALGSTGQTLGRQIVGVKVISEQSGEPLGTGKAIGRQLFAWLISAQLLYLGFLWALWDGNQQTWHDKVVGSIVIRA